MTPTLRILGMVLPLLAAATAQAQKNIVNEELDRASGTRVQVRSVFDPLPPSGYAPMRVVAVNGQRRDAAWSFSFSSQNTTYRGQNRHTSSFTLQMPARSTQSALLLVPMSVAYGQRSYGFGSHSLRLDIEGTGFDGTPHFDHEARVANFPAVAISSNLAEYSIPGLNREVESRARSSSYYGSGRADIFGSQFEPEDLPDSWLGFSGFDYVLLSSTDWQKVKPQGRRALLEWARLGGHVHMFIPEGATPHGLGPPFLSGTGEKEMSLGSVQTIPWDGKKLPASETVARYWNKNKRVSDLTEGHANVSWPLLKLLGSPSFASWQVILFLVVFGVLVGPVNLFVLAPAGKRHKLFVTTLLLSVGASLAMVALILIQDGTGGTGRRFVAVNLEPEEAAAYVTQEQVSRTGVLFGAAYEMKQPALVEPVALPKSPWAKLTADMTSHPADLAQHGRERQGTYFQSRAEQGQVLQAVVPTRGRLELKTGLAPGAAPELVSALGFTVNQLFYIDAQGKVWQLREPLATGQSATLAEAQVLITDAWLTAGMAPADDALLKKLSHAIARKRSYFIATARQAPGFTLETLPSIRWQDDRILVFGPVAQP